MKRLRCVKRRVLHRGRIFTLVQEVLDVDGHRAVRETLVHPGAVVILPLLPDGRVVCVRQYRRAVGRELLELPAGTLEPGESPRACAARELEEETGWRARRIRQVACFYPAPGSTSERLLLFLAQGLVPGRMKLDSDEMVRPVLVPLRMAQAMARRGRIRDGKTIIGLLLAPSLLRRRARRPRRAA